VQNLQVLSFCLQLIIQVWSLKAENLGICIYGIVFCLSMLGCGELFFFFRSALRGWEGRATQGILPLTL
jgi:hypothetical protein